MSIDSKKDEKNWLIRTKHFQVLGPVTKSKILEFIEKGSLAPDDEICSGNGYWFYVGERELLERYIYGDLIQQFNPISEAHTILASDPYHKFAVSEVPLLEDENDFNLDGEIERSPSESMNSIIEAETQETDGNTGRVQGEKMILPSQENLDFPDVESLDLDSTFDEGGKTSDTLNLELQGKQADLSASKSTEVPPSIDRIVANQREENKNVEDGSILPVDDDLEYPDEPSSGDFDDFKVDLDVRTNNKEQLEITANHEVDQSSLLEVSDHDSVKLDIYKPELLSKESSLEEEEDVKEESLESNKGEKRKSKLSSIKNQGGKKPNDKTKKEGFVKKDSYNQSSEKNKVEKKSDRYLIVLLVVVILILVFLIYGYSTILNRSFFSVIDSAHAQSTIALSNNVKKKMMGD